MIRFGVHCSIRNGLKNAIFEAERIGCEAVQIFTRSPRMWKHGFSSQKDIDEFKSLRNVKKIYPLVVHTPYLPNLATSKSKLYKLSLNSLEEDLSFCEKIAADYLVIHPGAYSEGATRENGIKRITNGINKVLNKVKGKTILLLENVAGGGRRIGKDFIEISQMIKGIKNRNRIGVCFDTAHAFGAGYDLSDKECINDILEKFNSIIGLKYMKVIHFNDSMAHLGSQKDRHHHLGKGHIGLEGFKYLIKKVKNEVEAGILETPKDSLRADKRNLSILFRLRKGHTTS
ncbi:MAG: deoxyribonuclease IV [Elusimicrobia bacterium]|nr:deoxyribonuclease IV [Elusimicrobiota bacterium]